MRAHGRSHQGQRATATVSSGQGWTVLFGQHDGSHMRAHAVLEPSRQPHLEVFPPGLPGEDTGASGGGRRGGQHLAQKLALWASGSQPGSLTHWEVPAVLVSIRKPHVGGCWGEAAGGRKPRLRPALSLTQSHRHHLLSALPSVRVWLPCAHTDVLPCSPASCTPRASLARLFHPECPSSPSWVLRGPAHCRRLAGVAGTPGPAPEPGPHTAPSHLPLNCEDLSGPVSCVS